MFVSIFSITAGTYSQEVTFNMNLKNAPLNEIFEEIQNQSEFILFYSNDDINVNKQKSVTVKEGTVDDVMNQILNDSKLSYSVEDRYILIYPSNEKPKNIKKVIEQKKESQEKKRKIKGKVTIKGETEGMPGVNIYVKENPGVGISTDMDGKFELNIPESSKTLIIKMIGFKTLEVKIGVQAEFDIVIEEETSMMDEVVVTGYLVQSREELTSSVAHVESKKLTEVNVSSIDKAFQGTAAGVTSTSSRGMPGSFASVRIRGTGSINAGSDPLYIIDGVQVITGGLGTSISSNALSSLNPEDIESLTVLKDAAATAIYGSKAANGVVVITTKSGKKGRTKINVKIEKGVSMMPDNGFDMMNSKELLQYQREAVDNARAHYGNDKYNWTDPNGDYYLPDNLANTDTDWWDEITRNGAMENYQVNFSGGNNNTTFYISGSYYNDEGPIVGFGFERFTGNIKLDHTSDNKKFKTGTKITGSYTDQKWLVDDSGGRYAWENPIFAAMVIPPFYKVKNADGSFNWDLNGVHGDYNPVGVAENTDKDIQYYKIMSSSYASYEILKGLTIKTTFGLEYNTTRNREYSTPSIPIWVDKKGNVYGRQSMGYRWTWQNLLTYKKTFLEKHNVTLMAGYEASREKYEYIWGSGEGANDDIPYLSAVSEKQEVGEWYGYQGMISSFSYLNYSYDGKYYLSASIRDDGASVFGEDKRHALFGSVGLGWSISNEKWFNIEQINNLKLRYSYGTTGNSDIGWYKSKGLYSTTNYNSKGGMLPDQLANPDLQWEKSATHNVAIDYSVLNNRISGTIEAYKSITTDMLFNQELSYTSGFGSLMTNVGEMERTGLELSLNSINIDTEFKWVTQFNISFPESEIISLGRNGNPGTGTRRNEVGYPVSSYWMYDYAGVNPANGLPLWKDEKGNLTSDYSKAVRVHVGSPEADFYGGITNSFSYKGFNLSCMFYFNYGNEIIYYDRFYSEHDGSNFGSNANIYALERWTKPGDVTSVPKPIVDNPTKSNDWSTSRWLDDGSYVRLKSLTLSYSLPKNIVQMANLQKLSVYIQGTNLWTHSNVHGLDPERGTSGTGAYKYPTPRAFIIGMDIDL